MLEQILQFIWSSLSSYKPSSITSTLISCLAITLFYLIVTIVFPPLNFPNNIPTIPFYVSFLGSYTDLDQQQIYDMYLREKLEKYGAAKIYFASRWNILVTRPEYLAQIFKYEDIFAKSGNQKKIPSSVLAEYTGDNVISAHGEVWKLYRSIITPGIQFPDMDPTFKNSQKFVRLISNHVSDKGPILPVSDLIQKFALANIGDSMLATDFRTLDSENAELHQRLKYVKSQIFKPFYLNFPFFDKLPIPSRQGAKKEVYKFRNYFCNKVKAAQSYGTAVNTNSAGYRLVEALASGKLNEKQFADNAVIIMVAGHENPQLFLTSLLYVLAKYHEVQEKIREEALKNTNYESINDLPYLNSVLYETLRMYPPLGQIINRCTTQPVTLGTNIHIPKGVYVGYNNFGTGRDRNAWGEDANIFKPERWGVTKEEVSKNYATAKSTSRLASFHGRKRACLGERFALFETRVVLLDLVKSFKIALDPTWKEKLTPAGPICPLMLRIKFEEINRDDIMPKTLNKL